MKNCEPASGRRRQIRHISVVSALVFIVLLALIDAVPDAGAIPFMGDGGYFVTLEYRVNFDSHSSGNLYLYFGTAEKGKLATGAGEEMKIEEMPNKIMIYLMTEFLGEELILDGGIGEEIARRALDPGRKMELVDPSLQFYWGKEDMGIEFVTDFEVPGAGSKLEYEYLKFVHDSALAKDPDVGNMYNKFINNKDYVRMKVEINARDPASMSLGEEGIGHLRTLHGEEFETRTTYAQFIIESNWIMLHGDNYKSASAVLKVFIGILVIGYLGLAAIWYLNKFKGKGLILPVTTIILSGMLWLGYFFPGVSIYSIGALSFYLMGAFFLGLVITCLFVNPKAREFEGYDKMKKEEEESVKVPEIEVPDVNDYLLPFEGETDGDRRSFYKVLGVDRSASASDIKKAYIARIKDYHPDNYQDAPERIRDAADEEAARINEAYESLMKALGYKK